MRVLVACEFSGIVRDAFRALGHDAWSCDLEPCDKGPEFHFQMDIRELIAKDSDWDLMIAHPPCTYLCSSGLHYNLKRPGRAELTNQAVEFVTWLWNLPIERIAIENPIGCLSTRMCKPTQIIQPYQFGHDASKSTCLWLKNLPPLEHTEYIPPKLMEYRGKTVKRWANQTPHGSNKLGPSKDRWKLRSLTYEGIAKAMAEQWGI